VLGQEAELIVYVADMFEYGVGDDEIDGAIPEGKGPTVAYDEWREGVRTNLNVAASNNPDERSDSVLNHPTRRPSTAAGANEDHGPQSLLLDVSSHEGELAAPVPSAEAMLRPVNDPHARPPVLLGDMRRTTTPRHSDHLTDQPRRLLQGERHAD
jgi:hypothetical protein